MHAGNVHYYFPTMDDLFIALLDRGADKNMARMAAALAAPKPLRALWELSTNAGRIGVLDELMAAARHRPLLRERVVALAGTVRVMQIEALRALIPQYGMDESVFPAELLAAAIQGTALLMLREEALGVEGPHGVAVQRSRVADRLTRISKENLNICSSAGRLMR